MSPQDGWVLSIDFGTSNTAAAYLADGRVRPIPLESGSTTMPSAVVLTDSGYRVGRPAENARRARPDAFEGAPKRLLGMEPVPLGDREVPPEELVAEVLTVVRARAISRAGGTPPSRLVLTIPAQWGATKRQALVGAAERAGFPRGQIRLFPEPLAALHAYVEPSQLRPGERVAVVDFGGGTCDVAVLERTADATPGRDLAVVAADGDERLGGEDLDDRLHAWVLEQLRANGDGRLVELLQNPDHLGEALTLRTVVRSAKQDLSEHPDTEVAVSVAGLERVLRVSREEYEGLIAPEMARMAELARRVLETSGTHRLVRLFLTGGTAHTPAVARALHEVTGILAEPLGDPKLAVAEGALRAPAMHGVGAAPPPPPPPPPGVPLPPEVPVPRGPSTGPAPVPATEGAHVPGARAPATPWYARGGVIGAALAGVLVLGGGMIWAIVALGSDNSSTTGDGGPDGGTTPTTTCWDGSTTTSTCPALVGAAAASWLYDTDVTAAATCAAGDPSTLSGAVEEVYQCQWPDLAANVLLLRYSTVAGAGEVWTGYGYEQSEWSIVDDAAPAGARFAGEFTREDGAIWSDEIRCFDVIPWCYEVEAPDTATVSAGLERIAVQSTTVLEEVLATQ